MQTILSLIDGAPEAMKAWHRVASMLEKLEEPPLERLDRIIDGLWTDLRGRSGFGDACDMVRGDDDVWEDVCSVWRAIIGEVRPVMSAQHEEVIRGVQLHVPSVEVRKLAAAAAESHRKRAAVYESQLSNLKDAGEQPDQNVSHDFMSNAKRRAESHRDRVNFFTFLAAHVPDGRTYELSISDLRTLGVTEEHF
jgi:hypothetical protein